MLFLAFTAFAGCQSFDHVQFVVPHIHEDHLISSLHAIAKGDLSYTHLGARLYEEMIVVDLIFRSAGLGGKLFHQLEPEIEQALRDIYGSQVSVIRDRTKLLPFPKREKKEGSE